MKEYEIECSLYDDSWLKNSDLSHSEGDKRLYSYTKLEAQLENEAHEALPRFMY